jgi:MoaA/NifB/PqqE/SkfB family radical SAM enzyme
MILFLTNACQLRCRYCGFHKERPVFMDVGIVKRVVDQMVEVGDHWVVLTGGEPGLHPAFKEITDYILDSDLSLGFITNGFDWHLYENLLHKCLNFVCVSIDGVGALHESQRGEGTFERAVETIKVFAEHHDVRSMTVVTPLNMRGIPDTIEYLAGIGVSEVQFGGMLPFVREDWVLSDSQRQNSISLIKAGEERAGVGCTINESLWTPGGLRFCPGLEGLRDVAVLPDGRLQLCCDLEGDHGIIDYVGDVALEDLIEEARKMACKVRMERESRFIQGKFFDGFDTCLFCERVLKGMGRE